MRKMDEMEAAHETQAVQIVFIYSIVFEVICWLIQCYQAKGFIYTDMLFLLNTQMLVLFLARSYFKIYVDDSIGKKGIRRLLIFIAVILLIGCIVAGLTQVL